LIEFGYAGEILKIDLSEQKITRLETADYSDRFIGGRGIAAKIYWDQTTPETKAFAPENCLVFITGPIAGFTRFSGCRWQICGKSPMMEAEVFSYANLGGSWGAWLKYSGYDGIVITGVAPNPVYLYIDSEGNVQIRRADDLWGHDTIETREILQNEYGKEARIVCIGPAAENMVTFATVLASENSSGSSGLGAVMGSKRLKAIVVKAWNKKMPEAASLELVQSLANQVFEVNKRNWEDGHQKTLTGRLTACYGCVSGCSRRSYEAEKNRKFKSFCQATLVYLKPAIKYYGAGTDVGHLGERLCDKFGLDTIVMEPLIVWLEQCYAAGILSEEETGLPLSRLGSIEFIETLVRKISFREGFGEVLAQGILKAAKIVGKGSEKLFNDIVANRAGEVLEYDPRLMLANALLYATEPRRPIQLLHTVAFPLRRWIWWLQGIEGSLLSTEMLNRVAEVYWGSDEAALFTTYAGKALAAKVIQDYGYIKDSLVLCDLIWPIYQVHAEDPILKLGTLESKIVSAITGRNIDESELLTIGERIFNLQRAIMIRQNWGGRQGDTLLDYYYEEPTQGVYFDPECIVPDKDGKPVSMNGNVINRADFEKMKDEYYSLRGWDVATGLQTRRKLEGLDLDDIAMELEKSGYLK
jgi:aldehyde:ferredoxin oxidoreductase